MSRNVHDLISDISEMLDTVENECINLIEDKEDLQEKLKDLDEQEKEFPKAYDLGFEEGFAKGERSMQEKANKIIEYEKEQEKIHIGDVVTVDGCNCIVLDVYDNGNTLSVITKSGAVVTLHKSCATKTGKHYPIDKMLKEL